MFNPVLSGGGGGGDGAKKLRTSGPLFSYNPKLARCVHDTC